MKDTIHNCFDHQDLFRCLSSRRRCYNEKKNWFYYFCLKLVCEPLKQYEINT